MSLIAWARSRPHRLRTAETTELMLQLVANGRGVCVIPDWVLRQDGADLPIRSVSIGAGSGLEKSIHVGFRQEDEGGNT